MQFYIGLSLSAEPSPKSEKITCKNGIPLFYCLGILERFKETKTRR